jgi:hypothetical protein
MWTSDELDEIGSIEEMEIAPLRANGTLRNPVTIWVVRHADDLYIRSWRAHNGAWFRSAKESHEGRLWAGGVEKNVTFVEETDPAVNDHIDTGYHTKYSRYPEYVAPMVSAEVRATTLKLLPRSTNK